MPLRSLKTRGAAAALAALDAMPSEAIASYQPYWALRAYLLRAGHRTTEAKDAYARAIGLTEDAAARASLITQMAAVR
jgi:RNA polymerase sigma-70 factor, ECF subfamily